MNDKWSQRISIYKKGPYHVSIVGRIFIWYAFVLQVIVSDLMSNTIYNNIYDKQYLDFLQLDRISPTEYQHESLWQL